MRINLRSLVPLVVLLVLSPTSLAAQELEAACVALGNGSVGAWAEQRMQGSLGTVDMKFALVSSRGTTWYEITAVNAQGASIIQLEVPGFPFRPDEIASAVTKTGATPAMIIPEAVLRQYQATAMSSPLSDLEAQCRTAEVVGAEDVTVTAGSFQTTHLRFPDNGSDVWVSADVPFGIVRGVISGQGTLELLSYGSDATASITETPLALPGGGE